MLEHLSVYYDGACPVCAREIAFYKARSSPAAFAWIDITRANKTMLGPGLLREQALSRMHVRLASGALISGAAAFAQIWLRMPGFRWLGQLLSKPPFGALAEIAYRAFLKVRAIRRSRCV